MMMDIRVNKSFFYIFVCVYGQDTVHHFVFVEIGDGIDGGVVFVVLDDCGC